ncbi:MAG: zinc-binding dehydrogenase [Spirochaetia bacterium]
MNRIYINVVTDHIAKAPKTEDLSILKSMIEAEMIRPVIDKTYPLEEIVDEHRYVEKGHKKGNVVIQIGR